MRLVLAIGGNALLARGERPDAAMHLRHIASVGVALAGIANEHDLVLCLGNGPQTYPLAGESETDVSLTRPYPLDALGAQTQGLIGYWLTQALRNAGACKPVVSLLTQTLVSAADPAFGAPTTFVGRAYARDEAEGLAALHGWRVGREDTRWRRVVPSPEPLGFVEELSISRLLGGKMTVICGGGGGVTVSADAQGRLQGREAVVDNDLTAALLATTLGADRFVCSPTSPP